MSKLDILANDLRGLCFHQIGAGELSEHLVKLGYHKLPTPGSKEYQKFLLNPSEQNEHYNDSGLIEDAHWMIDDLLKAQAGKVLALLGGKE